LYKHPQKFLNTLYSHYGMNMEKEAKFYVRVRWRTTKAGIRMARITIPKDIARELELEDGEYIEVIIRKTKS